MEINSMNIFYLIGVAEALFLCIYVSGPGRYLQPRQNGKC